MLRESRKVSTGFKQTGRATAELLDLGEDNYRAIEYDTRALRPEEAKILGRAWGMPWQEFYLAGWKKAQADMERSTAAIARQVSETRVSERRLPYSDSDPASPRLPINMGMVDVPLVGSVRATGWDTPMESNAREPIPADQYADDVFVSFVVGDSMRDFLMEDDQVVWKLAMGRHQVNDVVYAVNQDGLVTVKQLKHDADGYYLHALNREFPDLRGVDDVEEAQWTVHGFLVAINRVDARGNTVRFHNPKRLRPEK